MSYIHLTTTERVKIETYLELGICTEMHHLGSE